MTLAVSNGVWLAGTVGVALFLAAVTSLWQLVAMRENRREHAATAERLSVLEKLMDRVYRRLFPFN